MATSSFALKQLQKYGWKEGQGLGPAKDGLAKPLTVSVKNNTHGLGSVSTEWSSTWWDHVFNKTASKIQIDRTEDDTITVSTTSKSSKKKSKKTKDGAQREMSKKEDGLLYGAFVKSGPPKDQDDEEDDEEKKDFSMPISDAELFKACGGRMARKGARATQTGKVKRTFGETLISVSEEEESDDDSTRPPPLAEEPKKKKKSKKSKATNDDTSTKSKKDKSKKKKKKRRTDADE